MTGTARIGLPIEDSGDAGPGWSASGGSGARRVVIGLGLAVAVGHLASLLVGADPLAVATKAALVPLLAAYVLVTTPRHRSPLVRLTLVALGFSWLGDVVPNLVPDDVSFLVMVGFFLVAQVAYIGAFAPRFRGGPLRRRPVLALPYVAAFVLLLVACVPGAGDLVAPAVVYGACLVTMAALATGVNRVATIGGAVFLVSDTLIALGAFAPWFDLPQADFWVMLTYIVGQILLVSGVLAADRADRAVSRSRAPGRAG
jgi:uncharacterized membrane protein YhhN